MAPTTRKAKAKRGRPPLPDDVRRDKRVTVNMDRRTLHRLVALSRRRGLPLGSTVEELIQAAIFGEASVPSRRDKRRGNG